MPIERKLAAIMFTDIVGYTAQMSKDEAVAISLLNKKESVLKPLITKHNGTYVKSTGDGSLSHFNSAVDAAMCAKRFQESIYDDKDLNVRVGVHLGDTIFEKGDIRGDGVNIASRLESMAVEGGVFVSKEVHDQLTNQKEFEGVSLGLQSMKGVGRLIEVYGLKGDKLSEPDPNKYQDEKIDKHSDDEVPSIAIVPFRNKGKEEDAFYAYGICADLISDVSSAGLIRVASKHQIEEAGKLPIDELAKVLDVRYMANGELWRMGDMFQLSVELYDTKDKKIVWSDRWEEKWDNLPSIKMNLSDGLLKALDITSKVERKVETTNTEAYEYYLKGKYRYQKRDNMEDMEIAQGLFQKAIKLDDSLIVAKTSLGTTYRETSNYDNAMEIYISALRQAEKCANKSVMGESLNDIGLIYSYKGDHNKALDYYNHSLKIFEEIGDKYQMRHILNNLGVINSQKGDHDIALDYYTRSLKIFEEIGDKYGMGNCNINIGIIYEKIGNHNKALDYYDKSLKIQKQIDDKQGIGYTFGVMGSAYIVKGDYNNAIDYFTRSLKIFEELGNKSGAGITIANLGRVYHKKGDHNKSLDYYIRSLDIFIVIGDKRGEGYNLMAIGIIYRDKSDYKKTEEYLEKSLAIQKKISFDAIKFESTTYLFLSYKLQGKEYDEKEIHTLIKETKNIEFELNYSLFKLLEDTSYLETAYNQVQETADNLEPDVAAKFLSYPIPAAIVEEWEKVK